MVHCSSITGNVFALHDLVHHPENNNRLLTALSGVPSSVPLLNPVMASINDLYKVHDRGYVEWLRHTILEAGVCKMIDMDTYVTAHSFDVALYAVGSSIKAMENAIDGRHCFALIRPPGHHAERNYAMGFCLLNNAAITATKALDIVDRVAIIDWDLHHGNGTQHTFYHSNRVLYCSIHERTGFPGTGNIHEIGEGHGKGYTVNAPLNGNSGIEDYSHIFTEVFSPAITKFKPELCIVSAGQDTLFDDPLSTMNLKPEDFGILTRILMDAVNLPLALILEGGYGPSHGDAIRHIFHALSGKPVKITYETQVKRHTLAIESALKKSHKLE